MLKIFKWNRYVGSKYIKYFKLKNTKLTHRVKDNKLSFKLGIKTSLKIVIAKCIIIKIYLYNSAVNTIAKVN